MNLHYYNKNESNTKLFPQNICFVLEPISKGGPNNMGSKSKRKSKDSSVGRRFDFVMQDAYNAGAKDHCYENFFDILTNP